MSSEGHFTNETRRLRQALGVAAAASLVLLAADPATRPAAGQDTASAGQGDATESIARVGVSEEFTAVMDSAPQSITWDQLREALAVHYQGAGTERVPLVVHALYIENGEIAQEHTSDPVEVLPGATSFNPDAYLPEESMVPSGYTISGSMALGTISLSPGELMTDLVSDIVLPMTEGSAALYLVATPPEDEWTGPTKSYPVLLQYSGGG